MCLSIKPQDLLYFNFEFKRIIEKYEVISKLKYKANDVFEFINISQFFLSISLISVIEIQNLVEIISILRTNDLKISCDYLVVK